MTTTTLDITPTLGTLQHDVSRDGIKIGAVILYIGFAGLKPYAAVFLTDRPSVSCDSHAEAMEAAAYAGAVVAGPVYGGLQHEAQIAGRFVGDIASATTQRGGVNYVAYQDRSNIHLPGFPCATYAEAAAYLIAQACLAEDARAERAARDRMSAARAAYLVTRDAYIVARDACDAAHAIYVAARDAHDNDD
jgi:hypothetical protein